MAEMVYLASPYTDKDKSVMLERFEAACKAAALLSKAGMWVFSPIAHTHPMVKYGLPHDFAYWEQFDRWFLERCDTLMILKLNGWSQSLGVTRELAIAKELGKPVEFMEIQHEATVAAPREGRQGSDGELPPWE